MEREVSTSGASAPHGQHGQQGHHGVAHPQAHASANANGESMLSLRRESQGTKTLASKNSLTNKFLIGEELGFGAFSKVYKGVDLQNGDFVAIKQISLEGLSERDQDDMVKEIDLLRNLKHKNIVKYFGSYRTRMHLYIILEYVENGSLSQIIKPNKFGAFPESLAMVYMKQILEGLAYLHEQDVIHRDIKGANILTTKEGIVKLADFGVATLSTQRDATHSDFSNPVVGTPYWMAPEVIEMSGVTFASDIWSVGCTAIEVLTGMPPYFDMMPMSALFHIVQDEHPPIPDGISSKMQSFLMKCFQKNPEKRPSARDLLQHEWFQILKSNFEVPEITQSPISLSGTTLQSDDEFATPTMQELYTEDTISSDGQRERQAVEGYPIAPSVSESLEAQEESSRVQENSKRMFPQIFSWLHRRTTSSLASSSTGEHRKSSREDFLNATHGLTQPYTLIPQACENEEQRILLNRQLTEEVKRLISMMRPEKREGIILSACQQCIALFAEHPSHKVTFLNFKGVVALQEILSKEVSPSVVHSIIQLLNLIMSEEVALHEHVAMAGLIPKVLQYISPQEGPWNLLPIRKEALQFGSVLCTQSKKSLDLFMTCNGMQYIAKILNDICHSESFNSLDLEQIRLVELAVDCIWAIVNSADTTKVDDICRLMSNAGIVVPLVHALKIFSMLAEDIKSESTDTRSPNALMTKLIKMGRSSYESMTSRVGKVSSVPDSLPIESDIAISMENSAEMNEEDNLGDKHQAHKHSLYLANAVTSSSTYLEKVGGLLCILSCSDTLVKSHLCEMGLLNMMLESLNALGGNTQLMLLTVLKQLSDDIDVTDQLVAAGSLQIVVSMLQEKTLNQESQHTAILLEILMHIIQSDKKHLEATVGYGLVPILCKLAFESDKYLALVLPFLFSLSHSGRKCRQELWKHNVPRLFVHLLDKTSWQQKALEALTTWLASDSRIEDFLLSKEIIEQIVSSLKDRTNLLALCHPLLLICHRSPRLNIALSMKNDLTKSLMDNLVNTDATNLLAILRFLDILYQHNPNPKTLILTNQLFERLRALSEDEMSGDMLLVKEKAQSLIQSLQINLVL